MLLWDDFVSLVENKVLIGKGKIEITDLKMCEKTYLKVFVKQKSEFSVEDCKNTLFYLNKYGQLIINGETVTQLELIIQWSYNHPIQ
jgi:hypothetical protein